MMGFKKKLTSFLPSDAQSKLQNVLTVEWEGQGKTVLVELPDGNKYGNGGNNEVEMAGLTSNSGYGGGGGGSYGRLDDDDEYERSYSRPSRSNHTNNDSYSYQSSTSTSKHRKTPSYSSKTLPPIPPRSTHLGGGSGGLVNSSAQVGYTNQNPFEPEYNSPQPSSSSTYSSSNSPYTGFTPQFYQQATFGNNEVYGSEYNKSSLGRTHENGGTRKMPNPWNNKYRADDIDFLGDLASTNQHHIGKGDGWNSPTSSTSGRYSQNSNSNSLDNPFR